MSDDRLLARAEALAELLSETLQELEYWRPPPLSDEPSRRERKRIMNLIKCCGRCGALGAPTDACYCDHST